MLTKNLYYVAPLALALAQLSCATNSKVPAPTEEPKSAKLTDIAKVQSVSDRFFWPDKIDLSPLRQHAAESNPLGENFNYAKEFKKLDLKAVKKDIAKIITTSQDWWPSDYGNYGPFFIRMAWHGAGTYRVTDGRGGASGAQQRFEPLNSWPDNVKKKYGRALSWGDLMVLTGNVSLETMGFKTFGFAGGRSDDWQSELVYWGPETKFLADERYKGGKDNGERKLDKPLGAVQMGLIYVNPEGPNGVPDPQLAANDIRETFGRMAMNDEETVALIAGGHTFGKAHGNGDVQKCVGVDPSTAGVEHQGFGWKNKCGAGNGKNTISSGLEGAWSAAPTQWTSQYLVNLFTYDWEKTKSPAGATQWIPKDGQAANTVPDAHDPSVKHAPIMFTTDLALKVDPAYNKIAKSFAEDPTKFQLAFAKAWFKLTHRDMGPRVRYLGSEVPKEALLWQDPVPAGHKLSAAEIATLKGKILHSGLTTPQLVRTAWASAASFRGTDRRGGANGARIALAPEKNWAVNDPAELAQVLAKLETVQKQFNRGGVKVSLADVIVLGGTAAVEQAAKNAGVSVKVPFSSGRGDATQEQTDVQSVAFLEPKADAFRNYYGEGNLLAPAQAMIDRAYVLKLTVPEMTALMGGLRVLDANDGNSKMGVFTTKPGTLSNDFFVNLLDMSTKWEKSATAEGVYFGLDRKTGAQKWTASPVDLIFGSHSELRAVSEVYASDDGKLKFVQDFVKAWTKVMNADRYDLM
jgi:catalase-peroxidase